MIRAALTLAIVMAGVGPAIAKCRNGENVSWYGEPQRIRSGGPFNPEAMTCAHPTAPDGSLVKITMTETGRSAVCTVNDLGPNPDTGCKVDVSRAMARQLGLLGAGVGRGIIQVLTFLRPAAAHEGVKKPRPPHRGGRG